MREPLQVERRDRGVADDDRALLLQVRQHQIGTVEQAGADMDGVGAVAQVDGKGLHG
jgi:hypothetical protein